MRRNVIGILLVVGATVSLLWPAGQAAAQTAAIELVSSSIVSEFPMGFRVEAEAKGSSDITSIALRLRVGQRTREAYDYLGGRGGAPLRPGKSVNAQFFWRTNTGARYIPPGTIITYNFEVDDADGGHLETEPQEFVYHDARFEWEEVSEGPITVSYHGPVKTRADKILAVILETMSVIGPVLGAGTEEPIRVTMYNNVKEMLEALPPRSATISRELITEGQAFSQEGTLLVLGGGRLAEGTASHEVTHILVHRAADGTIPRTPSWINEGLAEFGNVDPGFSYDIALDFAIAADSLLPVMYMRGMPSNPEDVIIFYGQSRSIIRYMIREFGRDKMTELMAVMKTDVKVEDAVEQVYGIDIVTLDNRWRESVGAPAYVPPGSDRARPTAIPRPALSLYSLTPQAEGQTIGAKEAEATATPTATPEPPPTPTPVPVAAAIPTEAPPTPLPAPEPEPTQPASGGGGGACQAPLPGTTGPLDLSLAGLLVGLVGLRLRRRVGR